MPSPHAQGYLRQPTLCRDTVVFVCDDDLWSVSTQGGRARRLTAGLGEPSTPVLSPDGVWLAYASRDEQHPEVYVMPAEGGPARRLTWLGPDVQVRGWLPSGEILFVTTFGQPFFRNYRAHTIACDGGLPQLLPFGQVNHLALTAAGLAGPRVIGRNTADPARWKRYRGGTAGHLWVDATGGGEFVRLPLVGNISSPMWLGGRIWYLSDAEGVGNLYSCRPDGSDVRRHTDHDRFYARHAQTDGARIVYQCGADLWLYDPQRDEAGRLDIEVPAHRAQAARRFAKAADHLGEVALHPKGHSIALDVRGKCFSLPLWEGAVRQHGASDGVRHRHAQWLADDSTPGSTPGSTLVTVSDGSGEERVEVHADGSTRSLDWDIGRVIALAAAPRGTRIALANHRNEVLVGDLSSGTLHVLDRSAHARSESLAWSPDGAWLAYPFWTSARQCAIKLAEVATGRSTLVTTPEFRDYAPAFDPAGRWLYFLSVRTFDPVYDNVQFELSFPRAARPYLIALQADAPPPFEPLLRGMKGDDHEEKKAADDKTGRDQRAPAPLRVDLDGIARRVAAFPVHEGRYGQIAGIGNGRSGGKVFWTLFDIPGAHGRGGHKEGPGRLEVFDFDTHRAETLMDKVDAFSLSADQGTLLVQSGKRLRALDPDKGPEKNGNGHDESPSRKSGWLDLERIRVSVEPRLEWKQMLREVWRLQRDQFWVADMSGVDWNDVWQRYAPLLDRVATRAELSDLIWELHGELGTSHAYEMGGDHRKPPALTLGQFAADFGLDGDAVRIDHIAQGDPWDAAADSPLNAIGVQARVGDRVLAVNGQAVTRARPPQAHAVHQAGCKIELRLERDGSTREVLLKLLADEVPARYREWVERNRGWVHAQSQGRVGYLHLPDMMSAGFAEFHRYFAAECDRDALIVDLRYNRGGHVSQLLLEKVARKRIGYDLQRWGQPQPYPNESPAGAVVALTNEHAGSDGDIFSHCFKLMKLGPLVGKRTWGGVIGIWPRHKLVDGSETTQPEFSFWFSDVGWQVENYGTDPDIEVDNSPQDAAAGRDRQLEKALEVALARAGAPGAHAPQFGPRPNLACPPLAPRNR